MNLEDIITLLIVNNNTAIQGYYSPMGGLTKAKVVHIATGHFPGNSYGVWAASIDRNSKLGYTTDDMFNLKITPEGLGLITNEIKKLKSFMTSYIG